MLYKLNTTGNIERSERVRIARLANFVLTEAVEGHIIASGAGSG